MIPIHIHGTEVDVHPLVPIILGLFAVTAVLILWLFLTGRGRS